jgi:hypothetical protein
MSPLHALHNMCLCPICKAFQELPDRSTTAFHRAALMRSGGGPGCAFLCNHLLLSYFIYCFSSCINQHFHLSCPLCLARCSQGTCPMQAIPLLFCNSSRAPVLILHSQLCFSPLRICFKSCHVPAVTLPLRIAWLLWTVCASRWMLRGGRWRGAPAALRGTLRRKLGRGEAAGTGGTWV